MTETTPLPLMTVDIGNSRIKLGEFTAPDEFSAPGDGGDLPQPTRTLQMSTPTWEPVEIALWLAPQKPRDFQWLCASVHQAAADKMQAWLADEVGTGSVRVLQNDDLPITVDVEHPEAVGIDRLLAAVAANRLRPPECPAVVIDLGTAITVDVVSREGKFCGGAILPGVEMSAKALHEYTDRLPQSEMSELDEPPPALGSSTDEAITSGLYWGAVGAIRALIGQLNKDMPVQPLAILTGGAARRVADLLEVPARYEEHLVLAGMAITAARRNV
ncbi:MAG: type III pantothenate kinase [Planctomycetota bacterium]|nr:type III pantothenate kinase [Planctomycetota bacterium]